MNGFKITSVALAFGVAATAAQAATITPVSYDMPDGIPGTVSGVYPGVGQVTSGGNHNDNTYNGANADGWLSGGTGKLTDGVVATQNLAMNQFEQADRYVVWQTQWLEGLGATDALGTPNPVITWNFDQEYQFSSMTLWFSRTYDSSEGPYMGLQLPSYIDVISQDGTTQRNWNEERNNDVGSLPQRLTIDLTGLDPTSSFMTSIRRGGSYIALSEVTFEGTPTTVVPLPASGVLLAAGLGAIGLMRRRRKAA